MQDDFDPWPPRLVVQTADPSDKAITVLAAPVVAALMRHTKLGASGLEILEFDGMDTLRIVARRLAAELGPGDAPTWHGFADTSVDPCAPETWRRCCHIVGLKFLAQDYTVETDSQLMYQPAQSSSLVSEQPRVASRKLQQV